jgi:hypothetical protein
MLNNTISILAMITVFLLGILIGDAILAISPPPTTGQLIVLLSLTVFSVMVVAVVLLSKALPGEFEEEEEVDYENVYGVCASREHISGMRVYSGGEVVRLQQRT